MPQPPPSQADPQETLRRLEDRLQRASAAAERLFSEAAAQATRAATAPRAGDGSETPSAGWQLPRSEPEERELELLLTMLASVRDRIPPDLRRRLAEALRELLLAVRALIDWSVQRLERERREAPEVHDIPLL
jgi:hypothetical protein